MQSLDSVRHEFAEFNPLAAEPIAVAAIHVDEPRPAKRQRRKKDVRAPTRDFPRDFQKYVGELIGAHEYEKHGRECIKNDVLIDMANTLGVRMDWILGAWRYWRADNRAPKGAHDIYEQQIATLRRLAPIRHLIAIAAHPHDAKPGELEDALEKLGALDELRAVGADIALLLDFAAEIRKQSEELLRRIFSIYEKRVDEAGVKTLLVYYCRDVANPPGIYPPGVSRWIEKGEKGEPS